MFTFSPVNVASQCLPRVLRQIETSDFHQVYIKKADGDFSNFEVSAVLCNGGKDARVLVELIPDDFEFSVQLPVETTDLKHTHLILKDPTTLVLQVQKKRKHHSSSRSRHSSAHAHHSQAHAHRNARHTEHAGCPSEESRHNQAPFTMEDLLRVLLGQYTSEPPVFRSHQSQEQDIFAALQRAVAENRRKEAMAQQAAIAQKQREAAIAEQRKQQQQMQAAILEAKRQAAIAEAYKHLKAAEAKREAAIAEAHRQFVISEAKRNKSIADIARRQQALLQQQRRERVEARQNKHVFDVLAAAIATANAQEQGRKQAQTPENARDSEHVTRVYHAPSVTSNVLQGSNDRRRKSVSTRDEQHELLQKWVHALFGASKEADEAATDSPKVSAQEAKSTTGTEPKQKTNANEAAQPPVTIVTPEQLAQVLGGIFPGDFAQFAPHAKTDAAPAPPAAPSQNPTVVEPQSPLRTASDEDTPEESVARSAETSPVTSPQLAPTSPTPELHRVPSIEEVEDEEFVLFKKRFGDH